MPLYEYHCQTCGQNFEVMQKFSDPLLSKKEGCELNCSLTKLVSRASFHLKGGGWYATDYKKGTSPSQTQAAASSPETPKKEATPAPTPTTGHACKGGGCH